MTSWMRWAGIVARVVVGGVWVVAGWLKLADPTESVRAVRAYDLLPEGLVPLVGHTLPVLELVVGLCLLVGLFVRSAPVVSALLLVAFVIGISAAWARGPSIECSCFGGGGGLVVLALVGSIGTAVQADRDDTSGPEVAKQRSRRRWRPVRARTR